MTDFEFVTASEIDFTGKLCAFETAAELGSMILRREGEYNQQLRNGGRKFAMPKGFALRYVRSDRDRTYDIPVYERRKTDPEFLSMRGQEPVDSVSEFFASYVNTNVSGHESFLLNADQSFFAPFHKTSRDLLSIVRLLPDAC